MKGIVFTIDAVFAMIIVTIAISILLYFNYVPVSQYIVKFSSLSELVHILSITTLGNFTATPLAGQMNNQYQGRQQTWPEMYQNGANNASNSNGPYSDSLILFINTTDNSNYKSFIVAGGDIYFANNAVSGGGLEGIQVLDYGYPVTNLQGVTPAFSTSIYSATAVTSILYYQNFLIYTNKTNIIAYDQQLAYNKWSNANAIPSSGIISAQVLAYRNIILVPVYVSGNPAETGIIGFYASNGTKAWIINTKGEVNSTAIVSGEIAAVVGNTVELFSYQNQGTPFSLYNVSYPYKPTRIIAYNGSAYVANSEEVSGISSYGGALFYQSVSNYTFAKGNVSSGSWTVYMPPYVGSALNEGQPVVAKNNLYTLWSNHYLVDQDTRTGAIKWITHIPYSGILSPHMALAYGMLFVMVGDNLLGFGTCPGNSRLSLLSNMVSLYANFMSGCADALLNSANPSQNASLMATGTTQNININITYPYAINLTVHPPYEVGGSYVDFGNSSSLSPEAGPSGRMSLCTWYRINSLSDYHGVLIKGKSHPSNGNAWEYTFDQEGYVPGTYTHPSFTVWSSSGSNIAFGQANAITFNSLRNNWSFACFTYDYPGQQAYYYFNGVQYPASITSSNGPATAGSGSLILGAGENSTNPTGNPPAFSNVSVADMQMYNIILSAGQIKTLYEQGITANPIQSDGLIGWWPLGGDTNDYSGNGHVGFPFNIYASEAGFISPGYSNSYDIGVAKAVVVAESMYIFPYNLGSYQIVQQNNMTYSAGIYSWS